MLYYECLFIVIEIIIFVAFVCKEKEERKKVESLGNDDMKCGLDGYWLVILNLQLQFFSFLFFSLLMLVGVLNTCTCLRKETRR